MPNTLHGPFAPINVVQGVTPANATWGNNAQKQSSTALASFNPDLIGSGFILTGVAASRHNSYASNVLADSPAHYYRLGEASGSLAAVDSSGNGQSLAYNGGPTLGAGGLLTGDTDTAVTFTSASSQYAAGIFTAGLPSGAAAVSLECWMKFAANPASTQFLLNVGDRSVATHSLALVLLSTGVVQLSNGTTLLNSAALSTGTRHHLVGTYDGTNLRLYVDNVLVAGPTAATNALAYTGNTITIGSQSGATPGAYYDGQIDEAAVYGSALSAARVTAHWTAGTTATTQLDVASGTAYLLQSDGTNARCDVVSTNFTTVTINTTYFLDLNPDGSWSWGTSHSGVTNHLTVASVATDGSGNAVGVTDLRPLNPT
ncbi:MAG TPA: LamG domain-containing protein, partial [Ktedonobacterales bacterium]|nr:LamG domain-containing protein [Ktedonobacterales bacterium]